MIREKMMMKLNITIKINQSQNLPPRKFYRNSPQHLINRRELSFHRRASHKTSSHFATELLRIIYVAESANIAKSANISESAQFRRIC
jgi:hypothetical protein